MKLSLTDTVKGGNLPNVSNQIAEYLRANEGKLIDVNLSLTDKRTSKQNAMYWGLIIPHFQKAFYQSWGENLDKDTVHNLLKENTITLKDSIVKEDKTVTFSRSTADLDIPEFTELIKELDILSFDYFGFNLTLPEDLEGSLNNG